MGGYVHAFDFATEVGGHKVVLHQLGAYANGVCGRQVALVHRHDDGLAGGLGVHDSFLGLGHDTVVGSHHEHHDVGHVCAAGAHLGEDGVAGGIDEGKGIVAVLHGVGTDVLGNATGFTGGHLGAAYVVEQGGLAVVHVTHHGDDGGTHLEGILGLFFHCHSFGLLDFFHGSLYAGALFAAHALVGEAVLLAQGGHLVAVERGARVGKHAHGQQFSNQLEGFHAHQRGEVGHRDGSFDVHHLAAILCSGGGSRCGLSLGGRSGSRGCLRGRGCSRCCLSRLLLAGLLAGGEQVQSLLLGGCGLLLLSSGSRSCLGRSCCLGSTGLFLLGAPDEVKHGSLLVFVVCHVLYKNRVPNVLSSRPWPWS